MELFKVIETFGIDPTCIGNRPRSWWIVDGVEEEEESAGAESGDLCVKTRDGGSNPIDADAFKVGNCIGSSCDGFDGTYRYYYYRALAAPAAALACTEQGQL